MSIDPVTFLYVPHKGDYTKISPLFAKIRKEVSSNFGSNMKYFGIYYDNPCCLVKQDDGRSIIGVCLEQGQDPKEFISNHKEYHVFEMKEIRGYGTSFYFGNMIDLLAGIYKGYPAMSAYGKEKKKLQEGRCSIEFYDYPKKEFVMVFPYLEENDEILNLSGFPKPETKDKDSKKEKNE
jgi:hypothetical protein